MKSIYVVGAAILIFVAAWWFSRSEDKSSAPSPAVASNLDSSRRMDGDVETAQQKGSGQPVASPSASTAGADVGPGSARAAPAGGANQLPRTDQANPSAPGTERVALRNAAENTAAQLADTKSSQPSDIDQTGCEAAAKTLKESLSIFDVTPTIAVWYAWSPPYPNGGRSGFDDLKARLLALLCTDTIPFDKSYPARMEFVAISPDSHVRILVGDNWISDGTVLSPLSDDEQAYLATAVQGRRNGPGPNRSRENFERWLAQNPNALLPAARPGGN